MHPIDTSTGTRACNKTDFEYEARVPGQTAARTIYHGFVFSSKRYKFLRFLEFFDAFNRFANLVGYSFSTPVASAPSQHTYGFAQPTAPVCAILFGLRRNRERGGVCAGVNAVRSLNSSLPHRKASV